MDRSTKVLVVVATLIASSIYAMAPLKAQDFKDKPVVEGPIGIGQVAASAKWLAWGQSSRRHPRDGFLVVKKRGGDERFKVSPKRGQATLGGFHGSKLVYQEFRRSWDNGGRSDLRMLDLRTKKSRALRHFNTRHYEFHPSISGRWILFGRLDHKHNRGTVHLGNLRTGQTVTLDRMIATRSILQIGQVNGDYAVWLKWLRGGLPRLIRYNIATGQRDVVPNNGKYNWAPSVTEDGTVYFGRTGRRCGLNGKILRWSSGDVETLVRLADGIDLSDGYVVDGARPEYFHNRVVCDRPRATAVYRVRERRSSPEPEPEPEETSTLTIGKAGNGEGTVTSSPAGIDCGGDCSEEYEEGTQVTLTATAADKNSFEGWSGGGCTGTEPCTITISEDTTVTASFKKGGG